MWIQIKKVFTFIIVAIMIAITLLFSNNIIHDNTKYGLYIKDSDHSDLINNTISRK